MMTMMTDDKITMNDIIWRAFSASSHEAFLSPKSPLGSADKAKNGRMV